MSINFNPKITPTNLNSTVNQANTVTPKIPGGGVKSPEAGITAEKSVKPVIGEKAAFSKELQEESKKGSQSSDRLDNLKKLIGGDEAAEPKFSGKLGETLEQNPDLKAKMNEALETVADNRSGKSDGIKTESPALPDHSGLYEAKETADQVLSSDSTADKAQNPKIFVNGKEFDRSQDTYTVKMHEHPGGFRPAGEEGEENQGVTNPSGKTKTGLSRIAAANPETLTQMKQRNPHLDTNEINQIMDKASSRTGVLNREAALERAGDFTSINHPEVKNMAATGAEMLETNKNLTPGELKNILDQTGKAGGDSLNGKASGKVAEALDGMMKNNPKLSNRDAALQLKKIASREQDGHLDGSGAVKSENPAGEIKAQTGKLSSEEIDKLMIETSDKGKMDPEAALSAAEKKISEKERLCERKESQMETLKAGANPAKTQDAELKPFETHLNDGKGNKTQESVREGGDGTVVHEFSSPDDIAPRRTSGGDTYMDFKGLDNYIRLDKDEEAALSGSKKKDTLGENVLAGLEMYVQSQTGQNDPLIDRGGDDETVRKIEKNHKSSDM